MTKTLPFLLGFAACLALTGAAQALTLHSNTISNGHSLPEEQALNTYGCTGGNIAPDLEWADPPEGTKSYLITVFDPDAPGNGWWHWIVFNIPATTMSVAKGAEDLPAGAIQSQTSFGSPGYGGACPPVGQHHHYQFAVTALSVDRLDLDAKAGPYEVQQAIEPYILKRATIITPYFRK